MPDTVQKPVAVQQRKQGRSPSYPAISLKKAVEKAQALFDHEGKYAVPMPSAFVAWGYGAKSSGGREARAALKYFGLISLEGDGENGKVKLTEDALRVLLDKREDQTERNDILRRLAVTPAIHKALLAQFPEGIKSPATVEHFLVFEQGYNEDAAAAVVEEFIETAEFTGLYKPDIKLDKGKSSNSHKPDDRTVEVGDLVQAEIGGTLQFDRPQRVRAVQELEDRKWVFVDGSEAGIPMEQVIIDAKAKAGQSGESAPPRLPESKRQPGAGMQEDKNSLDEGEAVLIWPENLSAASVLDLEYWLEGVLRKAKRRAGLKDDGTQL